jgi:hypothetical protein
MQEKARTDQKNPELERMQGKPQTEVKHPEEWQRDLNPDHMAGQNVGRTDADREQDLVSAHELKSLHRTLQEFTDDELRGIAVVREGARLQQGATYLDLNDPAREEFTATGEMEAGAGKCYVPKSEVAYPLWNRLRGIDDPERL